MNNISVIFDGNGSIYVTFSAGMYGLRRSVRKTEKIIEVLNQKDDNV